MTTGWQPSCPPCTCGPYFGGHHGIVLHADQVDDLVGLLTTIETWLHHATGQVHRDLHHYLATHRPDPARRLLADQVEDLLCRLTTTTTDWLPPGEDPDQPPTLLCQPEAADQLLEQLTATTGRLRRSGSDPRLAWTPC